MRESLNLTRDWTDLLLESATILERDTGNYQSRNHEAQELAKEIRAYLKASADVGEWWCHKCKAIVSPLQVTDSGCHEVCGTHLGGRLP